MYDPRLKCFQRWSVVNVGRWSLQLSALEFQTVVENFIEGKAFGLAMA